MNLPDKKSLDLAGLEAFTYVELRGTFR